jgi:cell division protein FtsA
VIDPIGLHGYRLEVEAHIVTAAATALQTYERCCEAAGVRAHAFVLEPLASGEAVLNEDEKELGVVLVDIGGGTTDIAIFLEGWVWHTVSLPSGGYHLTHDLAIGLQCPHPVAEEIKKRYGYAYAAGVTDNAPIEIAHFGDDSLEQLTRHDVAEILEHRVEDIFDLIQREMKRSGYDGLLPAGLVFCGGSALLPGLKEAGREYFGLPVRIAAPQDLSGLVDVLGNPAYATSVGLVEWGMHQDQAQGRLQRSRNGRAMGQSSPWMQRLRELWRALLPD